jgi:quercetin dioxygenase-like cupin family protein
MGVRLEKWEAGDGPLTEKRLLGLMEREGYEVAVFAYREGTAFPEHQHGQDKCDAVIEGTLRIRVDAEVFNLSAGDRLYLPAGTRHAADVVGRRTVVSLDGTKW